MAKTFRLKRYIQFYIGIDEIFRSKCLRIEIQYIFFLCNLFNLQNQHIRRMLSHKLTDVQGLSEITLLQITFLFIRVYPF